MPLIPLFRSAHLETIPSNKLVALLAKFSSVTTSQILLAVWEKSCEDTFECLHGSIATDDQTHTNSAVLMYGSATVERLVQLFQAAYDVVDEILRDRSQQKPALRDLLTGLPYSKPHQIDIFIPNDHIFIHSIASLPT